MSKDTAPASKPCILCGSLNHRPHVRKKGHLILRCADCGLVWLDLQPTEKALEELYSDAFFSSQDCQDGYTDYFACETHLKYNFRRRVEMIERVAAPANLLDIGCGPGFFLEVLPEGWNGWGIEISPFAASEARRRNLRVTQGLFTASMFEPGFFDVITLWDVIEHMPDPLGALRDANTLLKPGGALFLSTGDVNSLCARLCGKFWHLYIIPEHLFFFSPPVLDGMFAETGFEMRAHQYETCRYSLEYILERLVKMFGFRFDRATVARHTGNLLSRWIVPVNLFDISTVYAVKKT